MTQPNRPNPSHSRRRRQRREPEPMTYEDSSTIWIALIVMLIIYITALYLEQN